MLGTCFSWTSYRYCIIIILTAVINHRIRKNESRFTNGQSQFNKGFNKRPIEIPPSARSKKCTKYFIKINRIDIIHDLTAW